ncbi:MAG: Bax inhibitor-1 family protein [Planctomycetes bacterium]|nr:Bax inhibitor-1 family protein [Planctomycetota bacterium]
MMSSADVNTRAVFITRTYMHLLGAIVAFTVLEILFFMSGIAESFGTYVMSSGQFMWLGILGGCMVLSWIATSFAHRSTNPAGQYFGLGLYILGQAILFIPLLFIADRFFDGVIASAALITLMGFAALTAIVFITRKDFSFLRSFLMFAFGIALVAIIGGAIFGFELGMFFSIAMVLLAGGAILYDTSNVLHHYPEDRYVSASLQLFASVMLLFWYVLRIMISLAGDD